MRTWWRGQHVKSTLKSRLQWYVTGQNFLYARFDQLRISDTITATTNKKKLIPFNFKVGRTSTRRIRKLLRAASKSVPERQMTCQNKRERIPFRGKLTSKVSFQEKCHIHSKKSFQKDTLLQGARRIREEHGGSEWIREEQGRLLLLLLLLLPLFE